MTEKATHEKAETTRKKNVNGGKERMGKTEKRFCPKKRYKARTIETKARMALYTSLILFLPTLYVQ